MIFMKISEKNIHLRIKLKVTNEANDRIHQCLLKAVDFKLRVFVFYDRFYVKINLTK